jgi:hypothetical protein
LLRFTSFANLSFSSNGNVLYAMIKSENLSKSFSVKFGANYLSLLRFSLIFYKWSKGF